MGLYVFVEAPELSDRRVQGDALLELTEHHKVDRDDEWFPSTSGLAVVHSEPDEADDRSARAARRALEAFEAALGGPGWRAHLDEASAVDYVLHAELFGNQDAFRSSTYVHLREDGMLALGPVWDFDLSAGNVVEPALARLRACGWRTAPGPAPCSPTPASGPRSRAAPPGWTARCHRRPVSPGGERARAMGAARHAPRVRGGGSGCSACPATVTGCSTGRTTTRPSCASSSPTALRSGWAATRGRARPVRPATGSGASPSARRSTSRSWTWPRPGCTVPWGRTSRWPVLDRRVWPNPRARGSHRAEVRFLRARLDRHMGWIDRRIGGL